MSEPNPFNTFETPRRPEIGEASSPEDVAEYYHYADRILGVEWGDDGIPEEYTPEYVAAHPELMRIFTIRNEDHKIIAGAKITTLSDATKSRLGVDGGIYTGKDGVLLEYAVVRENERRNGLLADLTKKRLDWAREHAASFACTEIELSNPISAHAKTRDGFVFVGIKAPGAGIPNPYMVAVKPLDDSITIFDKNANFEEKIITVTENSEPELAELFADGWIGIDAQCENEHDPWTLVLRRPQE